MHYFIPILLAFPLALSAMDSEELKTIYTTIPIPIQVRIIASISLTEYWTSVFDVLSHEVPHYPILVTDSYASIVQHQDSSVKYSYPHNHHSTASNHSITGNVLVTDFVNQHLIMLYTIKRKSPEAWEKIQFKIPFKSASTSFASQLRDDLQSPIILSITTDIVE